MLIIFGRKKNISLGEKSFVDYLPTQKENINWQKKLPLQTKIFKTRKKAIFNHTTLLPSDVAFFCITLLSTTFKHIRNVVDFVGVDKDIVILASADH